MNVTVSRRAHFNAAHRLYRKDWSFEKNDQVFGKCNNPNFHGHNYELIASVTGDIDPETGYVIDVKILKDIIKSEVEDAFDHKNLNLDIPYFKKIIPTTENLAIYIWKKLNKAIELNNLNGIALTKLDVLDNLEKIKIGKDYNSFNDVADIEYLEMDGWQTSTKGIKKLKDLPKNARQYIETIENLSNTSVDLISTGASREDIIFIKNIFE